MANPLDLPKDRLATLDELGNRIFLHPLEISGYFRRWRTAAYIFLVGLFLILPWTTINGVQTILLDIPRRRFSILGITFWAHEAPMLFFVISGVAFSLAFAAVAWGRVWCGWMCPQTVFIDIVFRRIETWVEGNSHARRALDAAEMSLQKLFKRVLKWSLFLLATLIITNSFLAYFVGADRMIRMIQTPPQENIVAFLFTLVITLILLFNFGWFREQFCVIMCPYGRLQSVLMDDKSLTVLYDAARGEPRRNSKNAIEGAQGDCVDCFKCVAVCPTGIDIRRGQQLECIGCTACIDACDEIMTKVKKPKGLIRYDRIAKTTGRAHRWLRPTTILYSIVLTLIFSGLTYTVATRQPVSVTVLRATSSPYASGGEGQIVNHFRLELSNTLFKPVSLLLESAPVEGESSSENTVKVVSAINPVNVPVGKTSRVDFFVHYPQSLLKMGHAKARLKISSQNQDKSFIIFKELPLVGPIQ